ncbi:MAG: hypothetical protein V1711_01605 [bacterium]
MKSHLIHFITTIVACVATLIGYSFWYAAIAEKSAFVVDFQSQIETKTETAKRIASARATITEIKGDEAIVQSYFVPKTGVVTFIDNLETQGREQGTTVNVLSVSTGTDGSRPTLILSITVNGTFDAVMHTIGAIEYSPYDLSFSTLSMGQNEKNSWTANLGLVVGSVNSKSATSTP